MRIKDLEEIYYELQGINAVLCLLSCIGEDMDVKTVAIIASHFREQMEFILKDLEKQL